MSLNPYMCRNRTETWQTLQITQWSQLAHSPPAWCASMLWCVDAPTDELKEYVREYVRRSLQILELGYWRVSVHFKDAPGAYATIDPEENQNVAVLVITPKFWLLSKKARRQCIAHELVHLALAPLDSAIASVVNDQAQHVLGAVGERITDSLAWPIANLLPEWGS